MAATFKFGDLELDVTAYELRRLGRPVKIERIPMDLLILLLERRGDLVSREEIVERLWGKESFLDAESGVNTAVRKVRQALKDSTSHPVFIQTVSGKGYRFCGPSVSGLSPDPAPPASFENGGKAAAEQVAGAVPPEEGRRGSVWRRKLTIAAIVAAGSLLLTAVYLSRSFQLNSHSSMPVTVALLPFENLTSDADQEYFADGLT
jgi:DNA-binding winged helix-turn-helix (wHTH) protein